MNIKNRVVAFWPRSSMMNGKYGIRVLSTQADMNASWEILDSENIVKTKGAIAASIHDAHRQIRWKHENRRYESSQSRTKCLLIESYYIFRLVRSLFFEPALGYVAMSFDLHE